MAHHRNGGVGTTFALLMGVTVALILGAALARSRPLTPRAPAAAPTAAPPLAPTIAPTVAVAFATPTVSVVPTSRMPVLPIAPPTASPPTSPASAPAAGAPPATATPGLEAWTEVGRWQDQQIMVTEPFTVRGPWRICWALPDTRHTFQLMVGDAGQATWELLSGPPGAPVGAFDVTPGGSFRLMFHNDTPYTVVVVERPAATAHGAMAPPPCGG